MKELNQITIAMLKGIAKFGEDLQRITGDDERVPLTQAREEDATDFRECIENYDVTLAKYPDAYIYDHVVYAPTLDEDARGIGIDIEGGNVMLKRYTTLGPHEANVFVPRQADLHDVLAWLYANKPEAIDALVDAVRATEKPSEH